MSISAKKHWWELGRTRKNRCPLESLAVDTLAEEFTAAPRDQRLCGLLRGLRKLQEYIREKKPISPTLLIVRSGQWTARVARLDPSALGSPGLIFQAFFKFDSTKKRIFIVLFNSVGLNATLFFVET